MQRNGQHVIATASRVRGQRRADYALCPRCGIEITARNDRIDALCKDCRSVVRSR